MILDVQITAFNLTSKKGDHCGVVWTIHVQIHSYSITLLEKSFFLIATLRHSNIIDISEKISLKTDYEVYLIHNVLMFIPYLGGTFFMEWKILYIVRDLVIGG